MLEERMNKHYNKLTSTDFTILNYLIINKEQIQNMSVHEIADEVYVSSSSIVRLAKKLKYSGFSEMKYDMKKKKSDSIIQSGSSVDLLEKDLQDTLNLISEQNLNPICELVKHSRKVYCFGTDWGEKMAVNYLARNFLATNILIYQVPSLTEFLWIMDQLTENDLVIIISYRGENSDIKTILPILKAKSTPVISITPLSSNYLSTNADYRLYYSISNLEIDNTIDIEYNFFPSLNILCDFIFRFYHDHYYEGQHKNLNT